MNVYRHNFAADCPNNGAAIEYRIEIRTRNVVMAEDIVAAGKHAAAIDRPYHENIADMFFARFGGRQVLTAHHHGVDIETVRP